MYTFLLCESINYALKAQKALASIGIWSKVIRNPKYISKQHCGYGIKIMTSKLQSVKTALESKNIAIKAMSEL